MHPKSNPLSGKHLLFLPGIDGTGISFEPLRPHLPPGASVTVVRYPGDRDLDFDQTVRFAADQIPRRTKFIVLAESFSGPVAVELLGSGLIKAECLILCATFARSPRPKLIALSGGLPWSWLLRLPLPDTVLRLYVRGGKDAVNVLAGLWQPIRKLVRPRVIAHRLRLLNGIDVRHRLPQINVPCLYIQADGDRIVPAACLADFAQAVPDLTIRRIDGPHFILQARPQRCLAVIADFIAGMASAGTWGKDRTIILE